MLRFSSLLTAFVIVLGSIATDVTVQTQTVMAQEGPADCCSDAGPVPVDVISPKEFVFELSGRDANLEDSLFEYTSAGNTIHYSDGSCSHALDLTYDFSWVDEYGNPVFYPVSYYVEYVDADTGEWTTASGTTRTEPLLTGPLCTAELILVNEPFGPEYF